MAYRSDYYAPARTTTAPRKPVPAPPVDYSGGGRVGAGAVGTTGAQPPSTPYSPHNNNVLRADANGTLRWTTADVPEGVRMDIFGHVDGGSPAFAGLSTTPPGAPPSGGGGGGGGGKPPIDAAAIMALLQQGRPAQASWTNLDLPDYVAPKFRDFNGKKYDDLSAAATKAIAADRAVGDRTYGDARNEMQAATARNPFYGRNSTENPQQSAAMQRMMQANNVATDINQGDTNRGVQADQAFGNLTSILGAITDQSNQSRMRGLAGDQRRFGESLAAEGRGVKTTIGMARNAAMEQWQRDFDAYGLAEANKRYDTNVQELMYNNTGQNQVSQGNTQASNDWNQNAISALVELMAAGAKVNAGAWQK